MGPLRQGTRTLWLVQDRPSHHNGGSHCHPQQPATDGFVGERHEGPRDQWNLGENASVMKKRTIILMINIYCTGLISNVDKYYPK